MVMYEVHRHPVLQKYKTHICSRATLFQFFVVVLTFIPPLIIAYVTHGEFRKSGENPNLNTRIDAKYKFPYIL